MFDLDHAIAEWREQMNAGGIKSRHVLDELESHLRDDVEEQARTGLSTHDAFQAALQHLGQADALKHEFNKIGETKVSSERVRHTLLTLAGIPNSYLDQSMKTSSASIEPRWATYLKGGAFLAPALLLWLMSVVFVIPKLEQICADAGGVPLPGVIRIMVTLTRNGVFICGAMAMAFVLLEWRFSQWPRYRRAAVGIGTFLLNAVILISIFMMVVAALLAAPALMRHAG